MVTNGTFVRQFAASIKQLEESFEIEMIMVQFIYLTKGSKNHKYLLKYLDGQESVLILLTIFRNSNLSYRHLTNTSKTNTNNKHKFNISSLLI